MLLDQPTVDVHVPITPAEAQEAVSTGLYSDDGALKLVIQDTLLAESYENQKQWVLGWAQASGLYQSPFSAQYWEGTQVARSSIPFFTLATTVNGLVPQVIGGFYSDNPPFMVQNRPGTTSQTAEAIGAVLAYQLEDIKFRKQLELGVRNAVLYGTGIWKYGWETFSRDRVQYRRKEAPIQLPSALPGGSPIEIASANEAFEEEVITEQIDRPFFENITNLRHVLVDPSLSVPDIQKAKFVIYRRYMTWEDLDKLRDIDGYHIPSKAKLLEILFPPVEQPEDAAADSQMLSPQADARAERPSVDTTADVLQHPLEVLERWDGGRLIMVLQKKLVLCNEEHPYGDIPFLSVNWWDVPNAFWGMGLAKTIGSEQRLQQGLTNQWIDNVTLILNGVYVRKKNKSIPTQSIRISPGKIIEVDEKGDFEPLKRLDSVPEAGQQIELSKSRVELISGASSEATFGIAGSSGHSNVSRSATGANLIAAGAANRTSDFIEKMSDGVVMPFLYACHEMNRMLLPVSTLRDILNKELEHSYLKSNEAGPDGDVLPLLNAKVRFTILAASKLQAKRQMGIILPQIVQYVSAPAVTEQLAMQGMKIDIKQVIDMFYAVSDWKNKNELVVPMTDEDKKRHEQMLMGQQQTKAKDQMELQKQKFEQDQQLIDQENMGRAGRDAFKASLEKREEVEAGIPQEFQ